MVHCTMYFWNKTLHNLNHLFPHKKMTLCKITPIVHFPMGVMTPIGGFRGWHLCGVSWHITRIIPVQYNFYSWYYIRMKNRGEIPFTKMIWKKLICCFLLFNAKIMSYSEENLHAKIQMVNNIFLMKYLSKWPIRMMYEGQTNT